MSLQQLGYTEEKVVDMKLKALRIEGKAEAKKNSYDEAKASFEAALKLSRSEKVTKELDDLLLDIVKKKASEKKKEKALWQKAFSKREEEADEEKEHKRSPSSPATRSKAKSPASKIDKSHNGNEGTKENRIVNLSSESSNYMYRTWLGLGILGLMSGAAFWWLRRKH
jgi:hypothetical protein